MKSPLFGTLVTLAVAFGSIGPALAIDDSSVESLRAELSVYRTQMQAQTENALTKLKAIEASAAFSSCGHAGFRPDANCVAVVAETAMAIASASDIDPFRTIQLIQRERGKLSPQATVQFARLLDAARALQKAAARLNLNPKPACETDFQNAMVKITNYDKQKPEFNTAIVQQLICTGQPMALPRDIVHLNEVNTAVTVDFFKRALTDKQSDLTKMLLEFPELSAN